MVKRQLSAAKIAEEQMPGWKAVEATGPIRPFGVTNADAERSAPKVDAVMPSTQELRRKFLGADAVGAADEASSAPLESDVELVNMQSGDLVRTVAVNRSTGKIEWSQG
jgi:hypothetical protein